MIQKIGNIHCIFFARQQRIALSRSDKKTDTKIMQLQSIDDTYYELNSHDHGGSSSCAVGIFWVWVKDISRNDKSLVHLLGQMIKTLISWMPWVFILGLIRAMSCVGTTDLWRYISRSHYGDASGAYTKRMLHLFVPCRRDEFPIQFMCQDADIAPYQLQIILVY